MSLSWVRDCLDAAPCVLITLRQHKGSSPRESGARMVVNNDTVRGTIGGGNLEHQAISTAREMLGCHPANASGAVRDSAPATRLEPYGLGPHLNQCCGGAVELLFEFITSPPPGWLSTLSGALSRGDHAVLATATAEADVGHYLALPVGRQSELPAELQASVRNMLDDASHEAFTTVSTADGDWWLERISRNRKKVWLFGAGHVGKAVVKALSDLPFEVCWLDGRADEFPEQVPANVRVRQIDDLPGEVARAPAGAIFIIMTHSHALDEELCFAVMNRGDFEFLGMIGSVSKGRRFVHRLGKRGVPEDMLGRLVCPIGLPAITGKEPATIALSLAAQLMSQNEE